jgi:hypothetical protein
MRSLLICFHRPDSPVEKNVHTNDQKKGRQNYQCDQSFFSHLHSDSHIKICLCKIAFSKRLLQVLKATKSGQQADKMLTAPDQNLTWFEYQLFRHAYRFDKVLFD